MIAECRITETAINFNEHSRLAMKQIEYADDMIFYCLLIYFTIDLDFWQFVLKRSVNKKCSVFIKLSR